MPIRGKSAAPSIADDTLIVCLYPGANKEQVAEVLEQAHGTVTRTLHVDNDNYDILFIKPEPGKSDETIKKITEKRGKNFRSIDRNYTYGALTSFPSPPDDPEFTLQWNLSDIHWTQAQKKYINSQVRRPAITILDTGSFTYSPKNELVNIRQYDATGSEVKPEAPKDIEGHGTNVASVAGCLTDNETVIAGVASFKPTVPVDIVMLRIATPADVSNVPVTTFEIGRAHV